MSSLRVAASSMILASILLKKAFAERSLNNWFLLSIQPTGGIYSGNNIIGEYFYPDTSIIGIQNINYQYIDTNNCIDFFEYQIEVLESPTVIMGANSTVCENSNPFPLNSGSPIGGSYGGSYVINNHFDPMISGVGFHNISYTYVSNNGCVDSVYGQIEVLSVAVILSQDTSVCYSEDSLLLDFISPVGGVYSTSQVTNNYFQISSAPIGASEVIYAYTESNGCISIDTFTVYVNSNPVVSLSILDPVCQNASSFPITNGLPNGGTYSGVGISNNNFYPSIAGQGQFLVIYNYTDINNCYSSDSSYINVFPAPSIPIINQNLNVLSSTNALGYQWYHNGNLISGEINQFISVIDDGFYQVLITDANGCTEISQPFNYQTNSVEEFSDIGHLRIFPNPSNGNFTIDNLKNESIDISIFDLSGKLLFETNMNKPSININLGRINSGVYVIQSKSNSGIQIIKFIVI
jgi:hypothetical protein